MSVVQMLSFSGDKARGGFSTPDFLMRIRVSQL